MASLYAKSSLYILLHLYIMEELNRLDLITLQEHPQDQSFSFNPQTFADYLGQEALKDKLRIYVQAARMRSEPLDHVLLFGPPGLGKTTLATIIAHEMGVTIKICSGPTLERTGDLVAILSSMEPRTLLFIDEIHRMPTNVEEVLYNAMEQFKIDVIIGQGAGAKSLSLPLHPFTLVGATTKSGLISAPLRSRFGITERFDFYEEEALRDIIQQNAQFLNFDITPDAAFLLAHCSRGTPRIAKKLLRRIRDFSQVYNESADHAFTSRALGLLGIAADGLTSVDMTILQVIVTTFRGGPVGLDTIAAIVGEDADTIETVYEPFLMRKGYLEKTSRGRQIPAQQLPHLIKKFLGQQTLL
jgi:holliday junction DNA helicase RuvB